MGRGTSGNGFTAPLLSVDDDIVALVDQWVRQFELEGDDRDVLDGRDDLESSVVTHHPADTRVARTRPRLTVAAMRADWARRARPEDIGTAPVTTEEPALAPPSDGPAITPPKSAATAPPKSPATTPPKSSAPALPFTSSGLHTRFTDHIGGSISLCHVDGRVQHRGTAALRGPCTSIDAACRDLGLPDAVRRAFEFVSAWFGSPFDAVSTAAGRQRRADGLGGPIVTWGFWAFAGARIAQCLHEWKQQAPDAFDGHLARFGIDVTNATSDANGHARPILAVRWGDRTVHGRAAEWTLASEPPLLAALARAGRDPAAQRAQIDVALATCATPVLFHPCDRTDAAERLIVDTLTSPTDLAALLYLAKRHGPQATVRLVHMANRRAQFNASDEPWLSMLVRAIRARGHEHDACELLRIASSPELAS
jgi:hypothetical protein